MSATPAVQPGIQASSLAPQELAAPPLSVVGDRRWLALHLSWPLPRLPLLLDKLWPLTSQLLAEGLVDRFFFIRYSEGGPHLRLRLRLAVDADPGAVDRILHGARQMAEQAEGLLVEPRPVELEIERYGGPSHFPASLDFFALSSLGAIEFHGVYGDHAKDRRLPAVLARLLWQAAGSAADADEFVSLLDYYADFSDRFAAAAERAEAVFEKNPKPLLALFEHGIGSLLDTEPTTARRGFEDALLLSTAVNDLDPARRSSVMGSQMHMTANRLGLRNPEETYATRLLSKMVAAQETPWWWKSLEDARRSTLDAQREQDFDETFRSRLAQLLEEKR